MKRIAAVRSGEILFGRKRRFAHTKQPGRTERLIELRLT